MKSLDDPITVLKGVGEKREMALAEIGIVTIEDLLSHYPFRYEDIQEKEISEIQDQEKVTLKGTVVSEAVVTRYGYKKSRLNFRIMVEHDVLNVSFFNQPFLKEKVHLSEEIAIFGKWDAKRKGLTGMKILAVGNGDQQDFAPIYHVSKKIMQQTLIQLIQEAFFLYGDVIPEIVPENLRIKYKLLPRGKAMHNMHFPNTKEESHQAQRQVIFEEFFIYQIRIQGLRKKEKELTKGTKILYDVERLKSFTAQLPFELTAAQKRVTNEICRDLRSSTHMHRLLQGDVGSGKTIVSAIALYAVKTASYQGALMVPTEILAEQHAESLKEIFKHTDVTIAMLTSSVKTKDRKEILGNLADGKIDILIGTHALIQEDVIFQNLGLVIIDEQHRFGVKQRQALREKGLNPDVLFMTATPIPRTLAITAFGEMDVSVIDEMPKGRIPIETRWVRTSQFDTVLEWAKKELKKGRQMYVICPLIEESESIDVKNTVEIYQQLCHLFEPSFRVGLLHGKMKSQEKDEIMQKFKLNQIQLLVSTTVIEVGVNVPNASVMLIIDADRFGLAQLHQLRGRVGRGKHASYCILVANPKNEMGKERMKIMTETTDGFVLSEKDLEMRGPGDFFGAKQSGVPEFKVGNIVEDFHVLEAARSEAVSLWQEANWWENPANKRLAQVVKVGEQDHGYFD